MKVVVGFFAAAYLLSGCVTGSTIPHDDSPAAVQRDGGPTLCRDGTVPPCTPRD
ncbi:MAG TPA: hypothetical protein VGL34_31410 [Steroidobacteraceae bacterium]